MTEVEGYPEYSSETVCAIATEIMEENEDKSTEWCASIAADICGCDRMDVFDALIKHPDISGFRQAKEQQNDKR